MIDGCAAIHPHNLGLLMLRATSSTDHLGMAKQCDINAFDTNNLMSADEVMACILHMAHNMDEELRDPAFTILDAPAPRTCAFVAACRGFTNGRNHSRRGGRGGRGLAKKSNACGSLNNIMSSCTTSDDAILR
jgi:hypothetical protein